jgi:hypothetical protein
VFYDEQTGSLWDGFDGLALAGPAAGETAQRLPTPVWPWEAWRDAHPGGQVMVATLGNAAASLTEAANEELRLAQYLRAPSLPVLPKHFKPDESPLPAKAFVLGVSAGDESKAYPLQPLWDSQSEPVEDTVGGTPVRVVVSSARTAHVESPAEGVAADVMLWFAWKEAHPETGVYAAAAPEEGEAAATEGDAGMAEPAAETP